MARGLAKMKRMMKAPTTKPTRFTVVGRISLVTLAGMLLALSENTRADEPTLADQLIGYTELRTNLPGGRHANVRTERAFVIRADGSGRRELAETLTNDQDVWTQFAAWSPDGKSALIGRGWQSPENAKWEEQHKRFRMEPGKWLYDSYLLDMETAKLANVTAVERVSHYNSASFLPDGTKLLMTSLIDGVSKPFVMDLDGRNKRDVSGGTNGFTYGFTASPDGQLISYHENYQVYIANVDGSGKKRIETGNPFNFVPLWSPDGKWLLFVSGRHLNWDPYLVRRDGTGLRKLADLNDYRGTVSFLDVDDFHDGSSDLPTWSVDGKAVFYTAKVGQNVQMFRVALDGQPERLTKSAKGTLHYHPQPSPDGRRLLYGSKRNGVRQLYVLRLADRVERRLTDLQPGHAAMWAHWQPVDRSTGKRSAKEQ